IAITERHPISKMNRSKPQQRSVTGKVTDEEGNPLPGITITLKGADISATTNHEGAYKIDLFKDRHTLVFTSIGFLSQEIDVTEEPVLDVVLQSSESSLDEVVVLGFGQTQKKIAQTGSTASITTKELTQSPV